MLATMFAMVSTPIEAKTISDDVSQRVNIKLVTTSPNLFASTDKHAIVPGESLIQKEQRLQEEAKNAAVAAAAVKKSRETVVAVKRVYNDPANFNAIYSAAGNQFGVDPCILKAIHMVETGASGSTMRANPSGATGPMQFLPSTFRRHAVDGNGDGVKDIANVEDSIFSAAAYLVACGAPNFQKALWGYNPSKSYYSKIIRIAKSYGYVGQ